MLVGIIVGTYSSLFIATPVLVDTISKEEKKVEKHIKKFSIIFIQSKKEIQRKLNLFGQK
jgi:hypothetical protein